MIVASSQYNFVYGDQIHFPYSIASVISATRAAGVPMTLLPTAVQRDLFDEHVVRFAGADVLLCSCYVWNWEITNALAKAVKKRNPRCLVVFGGPQVPDVPGAEWYAAHPWVDACVHGEGEEAVKRLLVSLSLAKRSVITGPRVLAQPSSTTRGHPEPEGRLPRLQLDDLPSPYLDGTIDALAEPLRDGRKWIAAFETTRGCPFGCTYCLTGSTKIDTVMGRFRVDYLYEQGRDVGVLTYSHEKQRPIVSRATNVQMLEHYSSTVRVTLRSPDDIPSELGCTADHAFWQPSNAAAIEARHLCRGTRVAGISWEGESVEYEVVTVEKWEDEEPVYCLTVAETGWVYAEGVLVSNCDWGSLTFAKLKQYPLERLNAEIEWFGARRIPYIDCCDANFGILDRDRDIARKLRETKERTGYPQTFRQSWTKNSTTKVIDIAKELYDGGLLTAAGLALESLDDATLKATKRKNLPFKQYADLSKQFADAGLPTYTELIRGLPGETLESFKAGLGALIDDAHIGQIYIYNCSLLPNAPMADPAYIAEHGIATVRSPIYLAHSALDARDVREYEDIVAETATMPRADMEQACLYSWAVALGESLGLCDQLSTWYACTAGVGRIQFYGALLDFCEGIGSKTVLGEEYRRALAHTQYGYDGNGWGDADPELGDILWPIEEASWLRLVGLHPDETRLALAGFLRSLKHPEPMRAAVDQLAQLKQWTGDDFAAWAVDVIWHGRRPQRFRKTETREAA